MKKADDSAGRSGQSPEDAALLRHAFGFALFYFRGGRSREDVAQAAGVNSDTIYKIEAGRRAASFLVMTSLAAALNTTPAKMCTKAHEIYLGMLKKSPRA